jgi:hypothetical protein
MVDVNCPSDADQDLSRGKPVVQVDFSNEFHGFRSTVCFTNLGNQNLLIVSLKCKIT